MAFASQRSFPLSEGRWLHDIRVIGFANSSAPVSHLELQLLQHRGELHRYRAIVDSCLVVAIVRILTEGAAVSSVSAERRYQSFAWAGCFVVKPFDAVIKKIVAEPLAHQLCFDSDVFSWVCDSATAEWPSLLIFGELSYHPLRCVPPASLRQAVAATPPEEATVMRDEGTPGRLI